MPDSPQPPQSAALPRGWIEVELPGVMAPGRLRAASIGGVSPERDGCLVYHDGRCWSVLDTPAAILAKIAAAGEPEDRGKAFLDGYTAAVDAAEKCHVIQPKSAILVAEFMREMYPGIPTAQAKTIDSTDNNLRRFAEKCPPGPTWNSGFAAGVEAAANWLEEKDYNIYAAAVRALTPPKVGDGDGK